MNDNSRTMQATLERTSAPEIPDTRRSDCGQRDGTPGVETLELDVPAVVAALSQRLHAAGLPVSPERAISLAQALTLVGPVSRRQLYYTARAVFVSSLADLPAFDRVFASVFGSRLDAER